MRALLPPLSLLMSACASAPTDTNRFEAIATLGGAPVARVTLESGAEGRFTLTRSHRGRTTIEHATLNDEGRLRVWEQTTPESRTWVLFLDGTATWRRSSPDGDAAGSIALHPAPWWTPTLHLVTTDGPAQGWIWSNGRALPASLHRAPGGRRADTPAGPIEHLTQGEALLGWRDPWGAVTPDRVQAQPLPSLVNTPSLPQVRRLRRLVARWPDSAPITQVMPLLAEVPPDPTPISLPPPPYPTLPSTLPKVDPLPAAPTRLGTLRAAVTAARERLPAGPGAPAPFVQPALARGSGDCDERATLLVALLAQHRIEARVIHGWLLTEGPAERHAWVRIAWGGDVPTLDVDPSQPGLLADAGRVADPPWGPPRPGATLEVLEAIGPEGPIPTTHTPPR